MPVVSAFFSKAWCLFLALSGIAAESLHPQTFVACTNTWSSTKIRATANTTHAPKEHPKNGRYETYRQVWWYDRVCAALGGNNLLWCEARLPSCCNGAYQCTHVRTRHHHHSHASLELVGYVLLCSPMVPGSWSYRYYRIRLRGVKSCCCHCFGMH